WAVAIVHSPQEIQGVRLAVGSNAASVWWVKGQEVIGIYVDRQTVIDDGVSKRLTLKKGANVVRAATINGGAADFCAGFWMRRTGLSRRSPWAWPNSNVSVATRCSAQLARESPRKLLKI